MLKGVREKRTPFFALPEQRTKQGGRPPPHRHPVQFLDPIRSPPAELEGGDLVQLLPELQLQHCCQSVDLLAHIRVSAGNVVVLHLAEVKHGGSAPLPGRQ